MSECSASFQKFPLYVRVQYIISYQYYAISVLHFHAKHYMTKYNVSVKSTNVKHLEIVCILLCHNLSSKHRQRGATLDTQFRDSWMSMRQRTPIMRKTMNRSQIFEIRISLRALTVCFKSSILVLRIRL